MTYKLVLEFEEDYPLQEFVRALATDRVCVVPADGHSRTWTVKAKPTLYKEPTVGSIVNTIAGNNVGGIQCGNVYGGIVQDGIRRPHP